MNKPTKKELLAVCIELEKAIKAGLTSGNPYCNRYVKLALNALAKYRGEKPEWKVS